MSNPVEPEVKSELAYIECRHCLQLLPQAMFYSDKQRHTGFSRNCRACTSKLYKQKRLRKRGLPCDIHTTSDQRRLNLLRHLFTEYDGTKEIEIPVNALNHPHPARRACVIRPDPLTKRNLIIISSLRGSREFEFELVAPSVLLDLLAEVALQVRLP